MAEAEKDKLKFNRVRRWLFWPALVVFALNIETVTQIYGGDRILASAVQGGGPVIGWLTDALTSNTAAYIALFVSGAGFSAWVEWWLRRPKKPEPEVDPFENLAGLMTDLSRILGWNEPWKHLPENYTAISEAMVEEGLQELPPLDVSDKAAIRRTRAYLESCAPLVREAEIDLAVEVGAAVLNRLAEPSEPLLPPDTATETLQ